MATPVQREHERPGAPISAQGMRSVDLRAEGSQRDCRKPQHQTKGVSWFSNAARGVRGRMRQAGAHGRLEDRSTPYLSSHGGHSFMIGAAVKGALAPRSCGSPLTVVSIMKQCTAGKARLATAEFKNQRVALHL